MKTVALSLNHHNHPHSFLLSTMTNPVTSTSRSHALPSFDEDRSCEQWQLWARENRKVNNSKGMAPLRTRSCRTSLLQDDHVDPLVLKHMMQPASKTSKDSNQHQGKTENTSKQKQRIRASHSFRSLLQNNNGSERSFRRSDNKCLHQVDYRKGEPGESSWSDFSSLNERDRQRRADVAIEKEKEQLRHQLTDTTSHQGGGNDDGFGLAYTHSMILQQEAILADIRREELKQEAIRKKLLEEQEACSSTPGASCMTGGNDDVSAKLKHDSSLTRGNDSRQKHRIKDNNSPAKKKQSSSSSRTTSKEQQHQHQQEATTDIMRIHGRRCKVISESRVQDAMERGDSVYLLRCIECDEQLLAAKDLHMIFCSNCKSIFPTLLGKELCSTRL